MLRRITKRLLTETSGQEIAEAAVVLPIAFLVLLGIFWFGRAYNVYATVTHAAAEGARVAASSTCATCPALTPAQADAAVVTQITSILKADNLDVGQIQAYRPPAYATLPPGACDALVNNVLICRGVLLNNPTTAQTCTTAPTNPPAACGSMVSFRFKFSFPFTTNFQLIQIPAAGEARVED
jgi:Flp pilus assembly protein TadG